MRSAKSIIYKIINLLHSYSTHKPDLRFLLGICFLLLLSPAFSQDNSPYSRYGIGDLVPSSNVNSRGMGGISAAYNDVLSINYNNPASYGSFQAFKEQTSKKMTYGRAILDIGLNIENRTLKQPNTVGKFTASNALFSHIQLGVPLRPNWGLSFGLRPVSRISYKVSKVELLTDPNTGLPIDSAGTVNEGDGGSYLASLGTGFKIKIDSTQSISFGVNGGFLFGKKDYSTRRTLLNDSLAYNNANFQTKTSFNNITINGGIQYQARVSKAKQIFLTIGAFGNLRQTLNASQDIIRETYTYSTTSGNTRLDSAYEQKDIKGKIVYPSSITAGFVLEKFVSSKSAGWLIGVDFTQGNWDQYRFYGQRDNTLRTKRDIKVGAQLRPIPKGNYFSNVAYRFGFFTGPDYIYVNQKIPVTGGSFGMGLPIVNTTRQNNQATIINLALEYSRRGNNSSLLKENLFRISVGFSLSDLWFSKKKYD